jgi:hypothetical protein
VWQVAWMTLLLLAKWDTSAAGVDLSTRNWPGRTNATSAVTSAVRVAINAPSALFSFEVDNSILAVLALWWISLLSIAAKWVLCSLSIVAMRALYAAMRSSKASLPSRKCCEDIIR